MRTLICNYYNKAHSIKLLITMMKICYVCTLLILNKRCKSECDKHDLYGKRTRKLAYLFLKLYRMVTESRN